VSVSKDLDITFADPPASADLETVIVISLLCRRRANPDDPVIDPSDLGGWWGDAYPDVEGDLFGSRLWTLTGRGMPVALAEAPAIVKEALQWGVEDGLWLSVDVVAEAAGPGVMALTVRPTLPSGKIADVFGPWYLTV
jgi:phage gp46-like protein